MRDEATGREYVLISTTGTDRPGIVEEISEWIFQQGGNIEESRMSRLGDEFATLILVSGDEGLRQELEQNRETFETAHNLNVILKHVHPEPPSYRTPYLRYSLRATSLDHPGIVHKVTSLLHQRSVNIVAAHTNKTHAPFSGTSVFHIYMEIDLPAEISVNHLRDELRDLGEHDKIDFVLEPLPET